ncbi:alpha/beta hydrolase [Streptomyces sp. NPDC058739]|uniref:alpha/beta hydrolase n=1 Tax=Streptomyces sp. NPDC058739 TaxID=3346618 RepID=UPI0036A1288C
MSRRVIPTDATRSEVRFPVTSSGEHCTATLHLPAVSGTAAKPPLVVMAHGLGAVRDMGLRMYAERFAADGYACLVFDYRHFGTSDGSPRHLVSVTSQLADWTAALAYARGLEQADGDRLIAWGTSLGGGHVISTAARRPAGLVAAIAQCPFTDGIASALAMSRVTALKVSLAAARDLALARYGSEPYMIAVAGPRHSEALTTAPDAEAGYLSLVPAGCDFRNEVPARAVFDILRYRPGREAPRIDVPVLFSVCERDFVAPPGPTLRYAEQAPRAEIRTYPAGHFDIYSGEAFERVVADQLDFLRRHVPAAPETARTPA